MGRRLLRSLAVAVLAASLVWPATMTAGAWSSDEGNVSVFTGDFANSSSLEGLAVAVDGDGNIYTAGAFEVTVDFDPGPGTTNLTPSGFADFFVSKVDSSGDLVWVKSLAAPSYASAYGLALDDLDNVYVTGTISGEVDFDPDPASTYNLGCSNCNSAYVLQLDSSGDFGWAVAFGLPYQNAYGFGVAASLGGAAVYVTGMFSGTVDFDPGAGTANLTSEYHYDSFVVKLDAGELVWAKSFAGSSAQAWNSVVNSGHSVGFDNSGNVYVYGRFFGTVDFDPDPDETYNLTQNEEGYGHDAYLVKLNSSGSLEWARNFGDSNYPECANKFCPGRGAMAVDGSGNTYTVGTFKGPDTFDPASDPIGSGWPEGFLVKHDASGNFQWVKHYQTGSFKGGGVAVDNSGNVYITGSFGGTTDFDPDASGGELTATNYDTFVVNLDSSGTFGWAKSFSSADEV